MEGPSSAMTNALSLPGTFASCIHCFSLLQRGRNFPGDLLTLTAAFSTQHLRLAKWGEACGFADPKGYHDGLDAAERRPRLERTLRDMQVLLDSAIAVSQTFFENEEEGEIFVQSQVESTRWFWTPVKSRVSKNSKTVQRSMMDDDENLELDEQLSLSNLVQQLSSRISELEEATSGLPGVLERQRELVQGELERIEDIETLVLMEGARLGSDMVFEAVVARLQSLIDGHGTQESFNEAHEDWDTVSVAETIVPHSNPSTIAMEEEEITLIEPSSDGTGHETRNVNLDTLLHGSLIKRLSLEAFDQAMANFSNSLPSAAAAPYKQVIRRVNYELRNFSCDKTTTPDARWWNIHAIDSSLRDYLCSIEGPAQSPYSGGIFHLVLRLSTVLPTAYPLGPPRVRMLTKVYHPNINHRGEICLNLLENDWCSALTLEKLLISIAALLDKPGLEDALVPEVADVYQRDRATYERNARACTRKYACELTPGAELAKRFVESCWALEN